MDRRFPMMPSSSLFRSLDLHFARFVEEAAGTADRPLYAAAALASRAIREGHVCLDLADYAGRPLSLDPGEAAPETMPALSAWTDRLAASPVVATGGEERPLVLSGTLLYLFRYWDYENRLVSQLLRRSEGIVSDFDVALAKATIERLFAESPESVDRRKTAAAIALLKKFCLISGGPGTGKTSTVIRIAALLATLYTGENYPIALAAPTGKAATRLEESIAALLPGLDCPPEVLSAIPRTASTVHALLKPVPDSPRFRHDADHPLACKAVIVDEASMLDLALMTRLFEAVPIDSRIILIGDRDQLASVEAGALLGDLFGGDSPGYSAAMAAAIGSVMPEFPPAGDGAPSPADATVTLRTNFRFGNRSGIGLLSAAVNGGDVGAVTSILADHAIPDCGWWVPRSYADLLDRLRPLVVDRAEACFASDDPGEVLSLLRGFGILCAVRNGPFGVEGINARVEGMLAAGGLVPTAGPLYRGKPIMVTRNDYTSGLFNGDVGVIMPDPEEGGDLTAFFPDRENRVKAIAPVRLPPFETAYAMTVHKAQGSEFAATLLILPQNPSPLVTRELLYTGITRARERCDLWCSEETLKSAVTTRVRRSSGLRAKLDGANPYS
jgi:exodeoxyribonuclease V alpha subunit